MEGRVGGRKGGRKGRQGMEKGGRRVGGRVERVMKKKRNKNGDLVKGSSIYTSKAVSK